MRHRIEGGLKRTENMFQAPENEGFWGEILINWYVKEHPLKRPEIAFQPAENASKAPKITVEVLSTHRRNTTLSLDMLVPSIIISVVLRQPVNMHYLAGTAWISLYPIRHVVDSSDYLVWPLPFSG